VVAVPVYGLAMAFCDLHYFSDALGMQTAAYVLLPERAEPPYQVMFLLHGLSDDHTIWLRRTSIERYVEGLPLMVVMPNGGRGFYTDAAEGFAYGTAIGEELPALIRKTFPTTDVPWSITGLSMGGYGALRLALAYPQTFGSAHSHSGALEFGHSPFDNPEEPRVREFARIVGPTFAGGPNDLFHLVKSADPRPHIRIDCGVDDFLIESNRNYHAFLMEQGIPHEYEEFPGEHNWAYWDEHVQEALAFHRRNLNF